MGAKNFKETTVFKKAFMQAMQIFEVTKNFPADERYSLTDQIRRSSRSVCANIAEAYRKKRYPANFILKITDSDAENSETSVWLEFSLHCGYLKEESYHQLMLENEQIGKLLFHMVENPDKY